MGSFRCEAAAGNCCGSYVSEAKLGLTRMDVDCGPEIRCAVAAHHQSAAADVPLAAGEERRRKPPSRECQSENEEKTGFQVGERVHFSSAAPQRLDSFPLKTRRNNHVAESGVSPAPSKMCLPTRFPKLCRIGTQKPNSAMDSRAKRDGAAPPVGIEPFFAYN
jgi:hypothetical protein